jgi:hypothetical protein
MRVISLQVVEDSEANRTGIKTLLRSHFFSMDITGGRLLLFVLMSYPCRIPCALYKSKHPQANTSNIYFP